MLASRMPGILPPCSLEEILEINMIASVSGKLFDGKLITDRPFREVHHSCSMPAMVGGGTKAKPGEVSLAHHGVLFLDELAEFPRQVLDSLRQSLETGKVSISRVNSHITYPANFQLIAAMNPCRCGFLGDVARECKKAPICGDEYKNRISGPFMDRIDIVVNVGMVDIFGQQKIPVGESSAKIRERVITAREFQMSRQQKTNSEISGDELDRFCQLADFDQKILQNFAQKTTSSMRGITRILRVARTIADLELSDQINNRHLLEAISYRRKI